jgi:hypothetical protein
MADTVDNLENKPDNKQEIVSSVGYKRDEELYLPPNRYRATHDNPDPRQKVFWQFYLDLESETYKNAMQSALKAGYGVWVAKRITAHKWFQEYLREKQKRGLVKSAEKKLKTTLEADCFNGSERIDVGLLRVQTDVSKFVLDRLNPEYSPKQDITLEVQQQPISINYITPQQEQ